jgi:tetratricopeptide (TPR) repeat protein
MEACLAQAFATWNHQLERAISMKEAQRFEDAEQFFHEAVKISASYHPLFHFWESGLNTELGKIFLAAGNFSAAEQHFSRAIWLHRQNEAAKTGLEAAKNQSKNTDLKIYDTLKFASPLSKIVADDFSEKNILILHLEALTNNSVAAYSAAISCCEESHQEYHKLAAIPWLERANYFSEINAHALAKNDLRRAFDLDPETATPLLKRLAEIHS